MSVPESGSDFFNRFTSSCSNFPNLLGRFYRPETLVAWSTDLLASKEIEAPIRKGQFTIAVITLNKGNLALLSTLGAKHIAFLRTEGSIPRLSQILTKLSGHPPASELLIQ